MRDVPFDATVEFQRFKEIMRGVLSVSKVRLDELVKAAKATSPRNGNPDAPGQKRAMNRGTKERRRAG
jgi:hypothetical protein